LPLIDLVPEQCVELLKHENDSHSDSILTTPVLRINYHRESFSADEVLCSLRKWGSVTLHVILQCSYIQLDNMLTEERICNLYIKDYMQFPVQVNWYNDSIFHKSFF